MKEKPHNHDTIIYLNALLDAVQNSDKIDNKMIDIESMQSAMEEYLVKNEKHFSEPSSIHEKIALLGTQLSHAVIENRKEEADQMKADFLQLAEKHEHSAAMKLVPEFILEHTNSGPIYRHWNNEPEGIDFGIIQAELDDNATIGVIGDWGTGDPDAKALLQELKTHNPDIVIHLGDIYNSCKYDSEVIPKFIDVFNDVYNDPSGKARPPILSIAGNHDYMSKGGAGFYKLIDNVNEHHPTWQQKASYFCLRTKNKKWQFLGADTGINYPTYSHYNQHPGLEPDEYKWHFDKMNHFASKQEGRTIFLTHHPLYSADHPLQGSAFLNIDLANNFYKYLSDPTSKKSEIRLWLWGHNHWFIPYTNKVNVNGNTLDKGRLLGGSARHDLHTTSELVQSEFVIKHMRNGKPVPLVPDYTNGLPNHSYAVIKLSDADAEVSYYQTASWHPNKHDSVKMIPASQHNVLLREYVLDTKPVQKYPSS